MTLTPPPPPTTPILTEVSRLRRRGADTARRPVLDVPGQCLKVRHGHDARGILAEVVVVGRLAGRHGHHLWRWRRRWGGVVRCGWWSSYLARPGFTSYDTWQT